MEQKVSPVDVIAMCSASGEIRPLRLRMEDEEHQLMRVDIEEIVNIRQVQYVGIEATVYLCRATVRQKRWLFELKYTDVLPCLGEGKSKLCIMFEVQL